MDQNTMQMFEINEQIRFFGSLVGTQGLSEENNNVANEYLNKLLIAAKPAIDKLTASAAGIKLI